jgi:hypothetical protein
MVGDRSGEERDHRPRSRSKTGEEWRRDVARPEPHRTAPRKVRPKEIDALRARVRDAEERLLAPSEGQVGAIAKAKANCRAGWTT